MHSPACTGASWDPAGTVVPTKGLGVGRQQGPPPPSSAGSLPSLNASLGVCLFAFQQEAGSRGSSSSSGRERLISEPPLSQEKAGGPTVPSHLLGTPYSFGLPPSSVVQDSRFPPLK